jgi:TorA maturation chaperone TorD
MSAQRGSGVQAIPEEERARAGVYALIGRLLHAPPDEALLAQLRARSPQTSRVEADGVERAWGRLIEAALAAHPSELTDEFEVLFGGVGKLLVTPYTSHYIAETAPDKHLVALRENLARLGLTRRNMAFEIEDHGAAICDVMRALIERNESLEIQKAFFGQFVLPGMLPLCSAIEGVEQAHFYRHVAALVREFVELENSAFDMIDL